MTEAAMKDTAAPISDQVQSVKCVCCKLMEECTEEYVARVRARYQGHWICGLCGEAVKDELGRSEYRITTMEALNRHSNFCDKFRSCSPTDELIATVKELLIRSLDLSSSSPKGNHESALSSSQSCFSSLDT